MDFYLERLQKDIAAAIAGMTPEATTWHPVGKWCTAEILEHLYYTYTATTKGLQRSLENGSPQARVPTLQDRMRTLVVTRLKYLPPGRTAPKQARPRGLPPDQVQRDLFVKLAEMDDTIQQAADRFGSSTRLLDHPLLGPLNASQWRIFHWVHGHHHVRQILALRDAAQAASSREFPDRR